MKICIIGAGAVGGFIGTKLAAAGRANVCALARGETLHALQREGWRLQTADGLVQAKALASDDANTLGAQDLIIIAVKATALPQIVPLLTPLMHDDTIIMPALNGVPWWFCKHVAGFSPEPLQSVDANGEISIAIDVRRVLGCVVHASVGTPSPGLVQHKMGNGLIVGEANGGKSERAQHVVDVLADAGFDATHSNNIRYDIWYKLWGNMTMNPITAITGALGDAVLADPLVRNLCSAAMIEAQTIGAKIGVPIVQTPEDRHAITAKLGAFKPSMLQDVQAGRVIELDAIVGVVCEIGRRVNVPTPSIDALFGLTRLFARTKQLYPH